MADIPIIREDDGELLGYIAENHGVWVAKTIFKYIFARSDNRDSVERTVRDNGLSILAGVWNYFDRDDKMWHPCVLKEVFESRVVAVRTNEMGYEDPDFYKRVVIAHPNETNLIKA
jgi:hypothetical protein